MIIEPAADNQDSPLCENLDNGSFSDLLPEAPLLKAQSMSRLPSTVEIF